MLNDNPNNPLTQCHYALEDSHYNDSSSIGAESWFPNDNYYNPLYYEDCSEHKSCDQSLQAAKHSDYDRSDNHVKSLAAREEDLLSH